MSKIYSFLLLALFAACTANEANITPEEFTDSEVRLLLDHISNNLSQVDLIAAEEVIKKYKNFDDFIENGNSEEKAIFISKQPLPNSIVKKLSRLTEASKADLLQRVESKFNSDARVMGNCGDQCLMSSHEVWFDVYMATDSYQSADTASDFFYAGCLMGCTYK